MTSPKTWKDHFLSSGVPLEHNVRRTMEAVGISNPHERPYQRIDAAGNVNYASVDASGLYFSSDHRLVLEFVIECKYRHDSVRWLFTPATFDLQKGDPQFRDTFVILDKFAEAGIDADLVNSYADKYWACNNGIEITPKDSNPNSISHAVAQVQYSIAELAAEAWEHQIFELLGDTSPAWIVVPMVVTTAELWRLKVDASMEDIRAADEPSAIADSSDLLFLHRKPTIDLRNHTRDRINATLDPNAQEAIDDYSSYLQLFARSYPSTVAIVHYERLERVLRNLTSFFDQPYIYA